MKTSPALALFGLLLVSCGRQTPDAPVASRPESNDVAQPALPAPPISSSQTSNSVRHSTGPGDFSKVQSLAQAVQRNKAAKEVRVGDDAMQQFITHWKPKGKLAKDLESLLGKPDEQTVEYMSYRFDTGDWGWEWIFQLSGDTITNVYRIGIN